LRTPSMTQQRCSQSCRTVRPKKAMRSSGRAAGYPTSASHGDANSYQSGRRVGSAGGPRTPRPGSGGPVASATARTTPLAPAVPRTGFAPAADHPEATARQRREGLGVAGRSCHGPRIRAAPSTGDSENWPHPYHGSWAHRCAQLRFRRSRDSVDGTVMCSVQSFGRRRPADGHYGPLEAPKTPAASKDWG
jgi:hypothetical protein